MFSVDVSKLKRNDLGALVRVYSDALKHYGARRSIPRTLTDFLVNMVDDLPALLRRLAKVDTENGRA